MAHETPTIQATSRERTGSRYSQRLRRQGKLPAIIYGHKTDPLPVSVDETELLRHLHHGSHVMNLAVDGGAEQFCLIKDLQFGYLGDNVIHVDFTRVDLDEVVSVHVHIRFVGTPEPANHPGAILSHDLTELEVECKVNEIPESIRVDLSLMTENVFTVSQIELPEGVTTRLDPGTPVCYVSFVHRDEAAEGEEVEVEATDGEPEVITEAKKEDGPEEG